MWTAMDWHPNYSWCRFAWVGVVSVPLGVSKYVSVVFYSHYAPFKGSGNGARARAGVSAIIGMNGDIKCPWCGGKEILKRKKAVGHKKDSKFREGKKFCRVYKRRFSVLRREKSRG